MEQQAQQIDERTGTILEMAFDAFVEVDSAGRIVDWNSKAESTFGWSRSEAIGLDSRLIIPPNDRDAFERGLRKCLSSGNGELGAELVLAKALHRDGHEFPVEVTVAAVPRNGGRHIAAFVRDITAHKQLESALHESNERSRAILDHIEDGYCEVDLRGNYLCVNDAYCRMFNRTKEEVTGGSYKLYLDPDRAVVLREIYQNVYRTGEPVRSQVYEYKPGRFVEQSVSLKRNAKGEAVGFVTVIRDCTERKLHERELAKAKEAAEAANRAKSEFLANMSHEIRTPMNGIVGMTELALSTDLTGEQREFLSMVRSSADALLVIINDILDYSKIEAGKVILDPVRFNLAELIGDTMKSVAISAHAKGLELAFRTGNEVPLDLVGDSVRLRQVLLNLVGNAIKFTENGEVVLDVELEGRAEDMVTLRFSVRDTGIGIPVEKQARLFRPFEQADTSTTRHYGGTGLGLAISKRIVQLMDGTMGVMSTAGLGSTFYFSLNLGLAAASAYHSTPSPADLRGLRVLIVDDNATNRRILEELTQRWRMLPEVADSGAEGLSMLEQASTSGRPFPLVLLDEQMPGMDGLEVIRRIRDLALLRGVTIMMLTSAGQNSSAARCRELGVETYLIKPVRPSQLLTKIHDALGKLQRDPAPHKPQAQQAAARSLAILVAEDNLVNQKLAVAMLEKMGHRVTLAVNGLEAISKAGQVDYDLILMDVQMPEVDGFEATERIRHNELAGENRVPIIAMTAHAMTGDRERCIRAGMDDYVSKPVSRKSLEQAIARYADSNLRVSP